MTTFAKTLKGIEEIKGKVHGLSLVERSVLIFIDGKRSLDDLRALPRVDDLERILRLLQSYELIVPLTQNDTLVASTEGAFLQGVNETISPFRELPTQFQADTFNMAKHFMINTLNHFKGFYGATRLVRDIEASETHEELRTYYAAWCEQMDSVRASQKQGKKLRKDLLKVL